MACIYTHKHPDAVGQMCVRYRAQRKQQPDWSAESARCSFSFHIECTKPAADRLINARHRPLTIICHPHNRTVSFNHGTADQYLKEKYKF